MGKALGIISLIFGLIGLLLGWLIWIFFPILGYIVPGVAIVTGIIGIVVDDSKGMAIAGLILGAIGLIVIIVLPIIFVLILFSVPFIY
jgi:hypothetical protein